jgi:hypothetical protein
MGYRVMRLPRRLPRSLRWLTHRAGSASGPRPMPGGQIRRSRPDAAEARAKTLTAELAALEPIRPRPSRPGIRAAVAASDRLLTGLAWEWDQRPLLRRNLEEVLARHSPDLVLLEIVDGVIPGWGQASDRDALDFCRTASLAGVPVVLWVTAGDDPNRWATLAESADIVFLAHLDMARSWHAGRPTQPLETLGPAAQPRLYGPELGFPGGRDLGACLILESEGLAPMTADALSSLIAPAVKPLGTAEFDIWRLGPTSDAESLPQSLRPRELGIRPYDEVGRALGRYAVLVHAGSHDPRWTWPVLEAGAARAAVLSLPAYADALPAEIATHVAVAHDAKSLRSEIVARLRQSELRDRESVQLHRAVLDRHTYAHRVDTILEHLGRADVRLPAPTVSAVVPTNRTHEIENILENVGRQSHGQVELVLVLHGIEPDSTEIRAKARETGIDQLVITTVDASRTLGACMNAGIEAAAGTHIAKMDDDNFYGRHYLTDLVRAFAYTDAGIIGKWAHYVWLRSSGAVVLRYPSAEHTYERRVQGGSMLIDGGVARKLRFSDQPRAVDSELLDRAAAEGIQIYSADRFNFVSIRDVAPETHTWKVADSTFMTSSGRLVFYGDPRPHVDV